MTLLYNSGSFIAVFFLDKYALMSHINIPRATELKWQLYSLFNC